MNVHFYCPSLGLMATIRAPEPSGGAGRDDRLAVLDVRSVGMTLVEVDLVTAVADRRGKHALLGPCGQLSEAVRELFD